MKALIDERVLKDTPAQRWAEPREIGEVTKMKSLRTACCIATMSGSPIKTYQPGKYNRV
jgi:hypothetical protein